MSSVFGSVLILVVVAIQLLLIRTASCLNLTNTYLHHSCNNTEGKYKPGSEFEKLVKDDLQETVYNGNLSSGYRYRELSNDTNIISAVYKFQCRGDSYGPKCRSCLTTALSELWRKCPGNKGAIIWYDQCFFKLATHRSHTKIDYENDFYISNAKKVSGKPEAFNKEVLGILEKLAKKATDHKKQEGSKDYLYAASEMMVGKKKMYTMVQCTQDLFLYY